MKKALFLLGKLIFPALLLSVVVSTTAFAADRYWVGSDGTCTADWSDSDCWSASDGGSGGASVPGTSDTAYFTPSDNTSATIDQALTVNYLTINPSYTGTVTINNSSQTVNVNNDLTVGAGTFVTGGGNFNVGNDILMQGGDIQVYSSPVYVAGDVVMTNIFSDFQFLYDTSVDIDGQLDLQLGYFNASTRTATFQLDFDGLTQTGGAFYGGASTVEVAGDFSASHVNGGSALMQMSSGTTTVTGDFSVSTTGTMNFQPNSGLVKFTGISNHNINVSDASFAFYDLQIDKGASSSEMLLDLGVKIDNDLTISEGKLIANKKDVEVDGLTTVEDGGRFVGVSNYGNTVDFDGGLTLTGAGIAEVGSATFTVTGATTLNNTSRLDTSDDTSDFVGSVTMNDSSTMNIYNDMWVQNDFTQNSGSSVSFSSDSAGAVLDIDNNYDINGGSFAALDYDCSMDVHSTLSVDGGAFRPPYGGLVTGVITQSTGTFQATYGAVTTQNGGVTITGGTFYAPLNDLTIDGGLSVNGATAVFVGQDDDNVFVYGPLSLQNGADVTAPGTGVDESIMEVWGLTMASGTTFDDNDGYIKFGHDPALVDPQTMTIVDNRSSGAFSYNTLEVDLPTDGSYLDLNSSLTLSGDLFLTDGAIYSDNDATVSINGGLAVNYGFTSNGGSDLTLELTGIASTDSVIFGGSSVPAITVDNSNAQLMLAGTTGYDGAIAFKGDLTVDQGTVYMYVPDTTTPPSIIDSKTGYNPGTPTAIDMNFDTNTYVTVNGGTLDFDHSNGANGVGGDVDIYNYEQNGGTVYGVASPHTMTTYSYEVYSGSFTAGTGYYLYGTNHSYVNGQSGNPNDAVVDWTDATEVEFQRDLIAGYTGSTGSVDFSANDTIIHEGLTIQGGTTVAHNNGTVNFNVDGVWDQTILDFDYQTIDFYDVLIDADTGDGEVRMSMGTMNILGTLTLTNGWLGGGDFVANNGLVWNTTFDGGAASGGSPSISSGTLVIKTPSNFTIPDGVPMPSIAIDNTNNTNLVVSTSGTGALDVYSIDILTGIDSGGTFDNAADVDMDIYSMTIDNGSFNAGAGVITHERSVVVNGGTYDAETADINLELTLQIAGGIFDATSVTDFDSTYSYQSAVFNFDSGTFLAPSNGATITIVGGWDQETGFTFTPNNSTVEFAGTGYAYVDLGSYVTQDFYNVTIDKDNWLNLQYDTMNVTNLLTLNNGELRGGTNSRIVANDELTWNSGFDGAASSPAVLVIKTTEDVSIPGGAATIILELDNTNKSDLLVNTIGSGSLSIPGFTIASTLNGGATFDNDDKRTGAGLALTFGGAVTIEDGIFYDGGNNTNFNQAFYLQGGDYINQGGTINHSTYSTSLSSGTYDVGNGTMNLVNELDVSGATLDAGAATLVNIDLASSSYTYAFDFNSGTFTAPSGNMVLNGTWDQEDAAVFNHNDGTVRFTGEWDGRDISVNSADPGNEDRFNNLIIDMDVDGVAGTMEITGDGLYTDGFVVVANGELSNLYNRSIGVGGDWTVCPSVENYGRCGTGTGLFTPGTQPVTLGDGDHTLYGSTTFNNLSKTSNSTIYFEKGTTQTITGTWTATGTSGNLLALKSTGWDTNEVAYVNPTGTVDVDYVSIEDLDNVRGTDIDLSSAAVGHTENTDLGLNNQGWIFDVPYIPPVTVDEFPMWLLVLTMMLGVGFVVKNDILETVVVKK